MITMITMLTRMIRTCTHSRSSSSRRSSNVEAPQALQTALLLLFLRRPSPLPQPPNPFFLVLQSSSLLSRPPTLIFAVAQGASQDFPLPVLPSSSTPLFQVTTRAEIRFIFHANFWQNWFTRILQECALALVHIVQKPLFKGRFLIYLIVYKCRK